MHFAVCACLLVRGLVLCRSDANSFQNCLRRVCSVQFACLIGSASSSFVQIGAWGQVPPFSTFSSVHSVRLTNFSGPSVNLAWAPPRSFDGGGGWGYGPSNHVPPNSNIASDSGHFIWKILRKAIFFEVISLKRICKNRNFWGNVPRILNRGDTSPRPSGGSIHIIRRLATSICRGMPEV